MNKEPDIEIGTALISKTHINGNLQLSRQSTAENGPDIKKRNWIHALAILISCGFSAGVGYAAFVGQRAPQMVTFQTQFDSTVVLLENSIQAGFVQKFTASRLLQKLYGTAVKYGYGLTYGQQPPFFSLPGFADIFTELATLGGKTK